MEVNKSDVVAVKIGRFKMNGIVRDIVHGKKSKYHIHLIGGMMMVGIEEVVVSKEEIFKPSVEPSIIPPNLTSNLLIESADKDDSPEWLRRRLRARFLPRSARRH